MVIRLVEEHEVAMAPVFRPVCFLNFELFLFIVKELTVPYFQVFNSLVAVTSTMINNFPFIVPEDRRRKEKPGMNRFYRAYSLACPAAMQIYWNKRKCLHKKRVELPRDWFGTSTCPQFYCFGKPIWPPYIVICIRSIPCSGVLFAF